MDTKKLVVGQDVYMASGVYGLKGKVVKVTPSGVDVETVQEGGGLIVPGGVIYSFDADGKGCDGRHTYECGPWELDDIPYTQSPA